MNVQIIKGWVVIDSHYLGEEPEVFLVKDNRKVVPDDFNIASNRNVRHLMSNILNNFGYTDIKEESEYESGIDEKYFVPNVSMRLYASKKRESLDSIKEKLILDSMGLLNFQIDWYGYSEWTIEGFEIATFTLGGHDILKILQQHEGEFVYLVVEV